MAHYALFIGINEYSDRSMSTLSCAHRDAVELYSTFKNTLGYGGGARYLEKPNARAVLDEIDRLGAEAKTDDTFMLYFAGHGHQVGEDQYLLMPDARLADLQEGYLIGADALSLKHVMRNVARWQGRVRSLYVLDACRSPLQSQGARDGGRMKARMQEVLNGLVPREPWPQAWGSSDGASKAPRVAILNACADGGQAYEVKTLNRGIFSLCLQERIESHVRDGQIYVVTPEEVDELGRTMNERLPQGLRDREQKPWLSEQAEPVLLWEPAHRHDRTSRPTGSRDSAADKAEATMLDERAWKLAQVRAKTMGAKAYEDYLRQAPAGAAHEEEALVQIEKLDREQVERERLQRMRVDNAVVKAGEGESFAESSGRAPAEEKAAAIRAMLSALRAVLLVNKEGQQPPARDAAKPAAGPTADDAPAAAATRLVTFRRLPRDTDEENQRAAELARRRKRAEEEAAEIREMLSATRTVRVAKKEELQPQARDAAKPAAGPTTDDAAATAATRLNTPRGPLRDTNEENLRSAEMARRRDAVNQAFMKYMKPSAQLGAIIGNKPMNRTEAMKELWNYVVTHKLQDPANRRMINADSKLQAIFGKPQVAMGELAKLISGHLR